MAEIIVALDVSSEDEALGLIDRLPDLRWAKIDPMLFLSAGTAVIKALKDRGVKAVVVSPWELETMRSAVSKDTWLVVPGIRLPCVELEDQRRTADPRSAAEAGATHLVIGRPIVRSDQPGVVYQQICETIA